MTPTQLSKRKLEKEGCLVEITEHWNAFARKRNDLFGFIDLLAILDGRIYGIQTTSASNARARIKKILDSPKFDQVYAAGIKVVVHGWKKNKSNRWEVVEHIVTR